MAVVQCHMELRGRQGFDNRAIYLDFLSFFCHTTPSKYPDPPSNSREGLHFYPSTRLAALHSADRFLLFYPAQFAFADKPAFAADSAEDAALDYLFAEALEQAILRFIR